MQYYCCWNYCIRHGSRSLKSSVVAQAAESIVLKRLGTYNEVANAVVFLATEESSYITAQTINVNGGRTLIPGIKKSILLSVAVLKQFQVLKLLNLWIYMLLFQIEILTHHA